MQIRVTFRHMEATEGLKEQANSKVSKLKKYFQDPAEAHVVLSVERHEHIAEINISAHGMHLFAKDASADMYQSIDRAAAKLDKQLSKYHTKLVSHRPRNGKPLKMRTQAIEGHDFAADLPGNILETKEYEAKPMMLDEAVMQMDLQDSDFILFQNAKTNQINFLKRNSSEKLSLVEVVNS